MPRRSVACILSRARTAGVTRAMLWVSADAVRHLLVAAVGEELPSTGAACGGTGVDRPGRMRPTFDASAATGEAG